MGLNDPYYNQPWTPLTGNQEQMNRALGSIGDVPRANAQVENMRLANQEAAYYQPGRQATGPEQELGDFIRGMTQDGPPEFQERFRAELSQGPSLGTPMAAHGAQHQGGLASARPAPAAPPPGPQMPPMTSPGYAVQPPQTTGQDMDQFASSMKGLPTVTPNETGMERPMAAPRQTGPVRSPNQTPDVPGQGPTSRGPMTRGDVETYLKAAPFLRYSRTDPRAAIAQDKLEWEKTKYAQYLKPHWDQMDKTKRDIAALAARTRMATSDTERKANLELLKIKVQELRIHSDMLKAQVGGLRGITQEGETNNIVAQAEQDLAAAQAEVDAMEKSIGSGPTQPTVRNRQTVREEVKLRGPQGEEGTSPSGPELDKWLKANPGWTKVQ